MKRRAFWIPWVFLCLLAVAVAPAATTSSSSRLTVLSYNIHHAEGMDAKIDLARIANVIRSVSPDVVAMQEVDRRTQRSGGVDQLEALARLTSMSLIFGQTMPYEGGQYGNAVLTRLPIVGQSVHRLPSSPGREPRAVIVAELTAPSPTAGKAGERFRFFATHFDFTADSTDRLGSVAEIGKLVDARPDGPALLAGDLNSTPDSPALQALGAKWRIAGTGLALFTTPVNKPSRQIDFILYRPAESWRVVEARVLNEAVASDHRPISAVLELLP